MTATEPSTVVRPVAYPILSAWSAVSAYGVGRDALATGLSSGPAPTSGLDGDLSSAPVDSARLVPDFEIREVLGRKGTRAMDRATALAVKAVGDLLDSGAGRITGVGDDAALVLATNTGSAQSIMDFTRDSLVGEKPYFVDPARFPNTVMNCAAGQSAIWHRLRGPNTTIAAGRASGLMALRYALRLQCAGRATTVLCGAVEEFSPARAWLDWHARDADGGSALAGEGCVVLLLEPADPPAGNGRPALAEVRALEFGIAADPGDVRPALAECVRRALAAADVEPADVRIVAPSQPPGARRDAEDAAAADVLGPDAARLVDVSAALGDTGAASGAFQVAAVLAGAGTGSPADAAAGAALITSVDRDGVLGCALLGIR